MLLLYTGADALSRKESSEKSFGRHTTGIASPRCFDRLPSHISKIVVSTVCGGWANIAKFCGGPDRWATRIS